MEIRNNKNIRIGEVLQELGYVTDVQIEQAIAYQKEHKGVRLGGALIAMDFITEKQMLEALASRMNYDFVNTADINIDIKQWSLFRKCWLRSTA